LSNALGRLTEVGAAQYTLCLTDDGGIVDDLIVYREDDGYLLVPNAANWPKVADAVRASDPGRAEVVPRPDIAVLAVQGPRAPELVAQIFPVSADLDYMHLAPATYREAPARVCRTGYTGERGFELLVPGEVAPALWEELFERGAAVGGRPGGGGGGGPPRGPRVRAAGPGRGRPGPVGGTVRAGRGLRGRPGRAGRARHPAAGDGLRP